MGSQASRDAGAVMVALRRIVRMLRLADQTAQDLGLSAAQLFVLHSLAAEPATSINELAERTLTDQSSVSVVVAKLVARKLIGRKPSKTDRRRVEIALTAAGRDLVLTAPRVPQSLIVDAVLDMPAAQRRELVRSLDLLVARIGGNEIAPRMFLEEEHR